MCLHAAVVWNTSVIDTDFIPGTCVVKPDYCKANDGLGISHSVTHCRSSQKGACARAMGSERKNEKGRTKEGDGKINRKWRSYVGKNQMIIITWKEFATRNEEKKEAREEI